MSKYLFGLRVTGLCAVASWACLGLGCQEDRPSAVGARVVQVVATTGMIGDMARRIAGEHAVVKSLMGPGVDPHLYKPSEGDVRQLSQADLILFIGLNLEGKMGDILARMGARRPVVAVTESIPPAKLRHPTEFQGHPDPHVWFDVELWTYTLAPIERELIRLLPQHAAEIEANTRSLREELVELDRYVTAQLQKIPREKRVLVTAHDAFGYFGRRYDTDVVGLQGISTVSEAGIEDVRRVTDIIIARGVRAIFFESSVPRRTVEAVQEACRERGHDLQIGGELFSDAMGRAGTPEGTYPGMIRHNVKTIVEALK